MILFVSASEEELIFRSFDGDVLKVNTRSNETEILMKNTTFVCFFYSEISSELVITFKSLSYGENTYLL